MRSTASVPLYATDTRWPSASSSSFIVCAVSTWSSATTILSLTVPSSRSSCPCPLPILPCPTLRRFFTARPGRADEFPARPTGTVPQERHRMETSELMTRAIEFKARLEAVKEETPHPGWDWYPYGTLNNFYLIEQLLEGTGIDVAALCAGLPVLDVGAADGDTAFFFESLGIPAHVVDYPPTN